MARKPVTSDKAPKAIGPYSQAVWAGDLLYCSGQTPIDPATGQLAPGRIGEQTRQAFANLEAVLMESRLGLENVIKANVYLTSMSNFAGMNRVYQECFAPPFPVRTTVVVAACAECVGENRAGSEDRRVGFTGGASGGLPGLNSNVSFFGDVILGQCFNWNSGIAG